jgi:hypothetical protein
MIKLSKQSFFVNSNISDHKPTKGSVQGAISGRIHFLSEIFLFVFLHARIIHSQWSRLFAGEGVTGCGLSVSVSPYDFYYSREFPGGQSCLTHAGLSLSSGYARLRDLHIHAVDVRSTQLA